jgi:hypothetical protein
MSRGGNGGRGGKGGGWARLSCERQGLHWPLSMREEGRAGRITVGEARPVTTFVAWQATKLAGAHGNGARC